MTLVDHILEQCAREASPQFEARPLTGPDDVPLDYEHITTDWLTAVLCQNAPGVTVTGFRLGEDDDGSSNRRRIHIDYDGRRGDDRLPDTVFCKGAFAPDTRVLLGVTGAMHAESSFYRHARDMVEITAPRAYASIFDQGAFRSIVILEDLTDHVELTTVRSDVSLARANSQMEVLARLHGRFYESPAMSADPLSFITWPAWFQNLIALDLENSTDRGFREAESVIPERLFARANEVWGFTVEATAQHEKLPETLIHSDVHLGNWYAAPGDRMGLLDWQACCRGHWSRDLAYAISSGLTIDNRRAWEDDLIRHYLERLEANGGPVVSFEDAHRWYRQQLWGALAFWTVTLTPSDTMPDMQARDTSLENIARISQAIDDLDAVDAFV